MSQPKSKKPTRRKAAARQPAQRELLLTPKDKAVLKKVAPKYRASAELSLKLDKLRTELEEIPLKKAHPTAEEAERFWGRRTKILITEDSPIVVACVNEHRETCIRVLIGRKKTAFIPMQGDGLYVIRVPNGEFLRDWSGLVEFTPQQMASKYLQSMAAQYYISEEARTLLEEISLTGTTSSMIQENEIMATAAKSKVSTTKAKAKAPAKGKAPAKAAAPKKAATKASAAKAAPAGKKRGQGIGAFCSDLIRKGKDNDFILAAVAKQFPDATTSAASLAWYRNKIKQEG